MKSRIAWRGGPGPEEGMSRGLVCPGRMSVIRESSAGQRVPIAVRPSTSHAPHITANPSPAVGRMLSSVKSLTSLLSSFVILSPFLSCSKKLLIICSSLILVLVCNFQVCWSLLNVYVHRISCEECSAHILYVPMHALSCFSSSAFCCLLVMHSRWSTWTCFSFASQYPLSLLWKRNGSSFITSLVDQ